VFALSIGYLFFFLKKKYLALFDSVPFLAAHDTARDSSAAKRNLLAQNVKVRFVRGLESVAVKLGKNLLPGNTLVQA
jgi:hypothetical protein